MGELEAALKKIRVVILDVDGVLTDGRLITYPDGSESKAFHVHDGQGINFLRRAGIATALITGRASKAVELRASELGIEHLFQGDMNKLKCYRELLDKLGLDDEAAAYFGDDLPDIPVMRRVGVSVAVADARPEVRGIASYVTQARGGAGAVREFADLLLKAQGRWQPIVDAYMKND
jgi:3-deoxy-D-manno-octulosonate 8-phosphate phosphatase (KDO 8-P phosphatase)